LSHKDSAKSIVREVEAALRELEQSNRKRLNGTHEMLTLLGLEKYANCFYNQGLVDMRYVKLLSDGELTGIGIKSLGDRKKFLDAFQFMEDTPALFGSTLKAAADGLRLMRDPEAVLLSQKRVHGAHELLSLLGLEKYGKCFHSQRLLDMRYVRQLNDQELKDIGIADLGDRKKILDTFQYMEEAPALTDVELKSAEEGLRVMRDPEVALFNGIGELLRSVLDEEALPEIEAKFKEEGLSNCSFQQVKSLTDGDLDKLGVKKLGDRQRLLLQIEKLMKV